MKTYLVEAYNPEVKFDKGSLIVALTPLVCYQLDREEIEYSIIEDYYDEIELITHEDKYHKMQLQWIDKLNVFLQDNIKEVKELKLNLATIHYYYLKTFILDPLYIRCYTLRMFFEAEKPSAVTFVSLLPDKTPLDFTLRDNSQSFYSLVTEVWCKQNNIPLESVFVESVDDKSIQAISWYESLVIHLKRMLVKSSIANRAYLLYRYASRPPFIRQAGRKELGILMFTTAHLGVDFIVDALTRGHNIYLLSDSTMYKYSRLGARRYLDLKANYTEANEKIIWENTAKLLVGSELTKRINDECQLDVSSIALPRLKYFISNVCPTILEYFKVFMHFFERSAIDFVITPRENSPIELAAIAAANSHKDTKSVYFHHGDTIMDLNMWDITILSHFDINISPDEETKEYFRQKCQANRLSVKLFNSPHLFLPVHRIRYLREKGKVKRSKILYVPAMFTGSNCRYDGAHYPDTWYYQLQKAIVEHFAKRKDFAFVWKGLPMSGAAYNPIPNFIRDNNFTNIEFTTTPLRQHLLYADRIICDYPSTGFYEAVIAGIPTISLYYTALKVRPSAVERFGNMLAVFSDTSEAIERIDEFLDGNPEHYKVTPETKGQGVLDILEGIKSRKARR